jgi:hypothetical protein
LGIISRSHNGHLSPVSVTTNDTARLPRTTEIDQFRLSPLAISVVATSHTPFPLYLLIIPVVLTVEIGKPPFPPLL